MQSFTKEFPDFPATDVPNLPAEYDFVDTSWHNDACPSFTSDKLGLTLFIDFADASQREHPEAPRYSLQAQEAGVEVGGGSVDTDDLAVVLAALRKRADERIGVVPTDEQISVIADKFADVLREWLKPHEFAEMKVLNTTPDFADGCCASHNYCDANMAMDAAWRAVLGENAQINADDEAQAVAWGKAWDLARERHIGHASKQ